MDINLWLQCFTFHISVMFPSDVIELLTCHRSIGQAKSLWGRLVNYHTRFVFRRRSATSGGWGINTSLYSLWFTGKAASVLLHEACGSLMCTRDEKWCQEYTGTFKWEVWLLLSVCMGHLSIGLGGAKYRVVIHLQTYLDFL